MAPPNAVDSRRTPAFEARLRIVLPGIVGNVLTGIRFAIGILWIVLVPCEMLGVSAGLGYLVLNTRDSLAYSDFMAVVLVIGTIGFDLDGAARAMLRLWKGDTPRNERRLTPVETAFFAGGSCRSSAFGHSATPSHRGTFAAEDDVMGRSELDPGAKGRRPWNVGKKPGAKRALKPQQVWAIRFWLDRERRVRDRAMFEDAPLSERTEI